MTVYIQRAEGEPDLVVDCTADTIQIWLDQAKCVYISLDDIDARMLANVILGILSGRTK